jgi:hypothetical protein
MDIGFGCQQPNGIPLATLAELRIVTGLKSRRAALTNAAAGVTN